jgi:rhamnosyltransferase
VVLMSTYNGEVFLDDQLRSIFAQEGVSVAVVVRDDGSTDTTEQVLERWRGSARLTWAAGENLGPAASFMRLVSEAPPAQYYAFADQDDSWDPDKLSVAVDRLAGVQAGRPALYFSEKRVVDRELRPLNLTSPAAPRRSFGSSLLLSAGSGCTMVFNRALLEILRQHNQPAPGMHDHWIYKVCSAVGGAVVYDPVPHLSYRQHGSNVVSADESVKKRLVTWWQRARSGDRVAGSEAEELLAAYSALMPGENQEIARLASSYRQDWSTKWRLLTDPRFRTGRVVSDLAFQLAVLVNAF